MNHFMKNRIFVLMALLFGVQYAFASITVKGRVCDKSTGAPMEYATVRASSLPDSTFVAGVITDPNGHFSLELNKGRYVLEVQYMGFVPVYKNLTIDNTDIRLNETTKQLEWAVSSPDKILSVMFIIKPLADDASIWVAGVQVTSMNADDVLGDGTVSYDQAGTLTLKNAYIVAPDNNNAIFTTSSNPLTILVKGNNYLWSENATTVNIMSDLTIKGTGVGSYLNVNADANHNSYGAFYVEGTLTVEGKAGLTAEVQNGIDYPVISLGGTLPKLVVNDADLRASTEYYWATAISCLELELGTGIDFRHDDNDWTDIVGWDETNKTFTGTVKSRIWIGHENFPTDIENVTSDTDKAVKVLRNGQLYIIRDGKTFSVQGVAIH